MYAPTQFRDRSETEQALLGGVLPALIGGLAGFLIGASAVGYWVVAVLAAVGALVGGFEHGDGWEAADRGFFGGLIYGVSLLLVHELIHTKAKVSLGSFPPFVAVITTVVGMLLSAAGGRVASTKRRRTTPAPGPEPQA
ncbi:MAG: hypothetical protein QOC77_166 [Thermoleophilaceae bacterium]|nr:hypothetical protein [Thermoleophilaceae bacterium]